MEKQKNPSSKDSAALFSKPDATQATDTKDKGYLATVHVRFGESKDSGQLCFDVRKEKSDRVVAKLWQSEETSTFLHLGYSQGEGASVGTRFIWHF